MITLECANGLLRVGDLIAYPGKRGQKIATVVEIHVISSIYLEGHPASESVRIYVRPDGSRYWNAILRNPKNVVKVD